MVSHAASRVLQSSVVRTRLLPYLNEDPQLLGAIEVYLERARRDLAGSGAQATTAARDGHRPNGRAAPVCPVAPSRRAA